MARFVRTAQKNQRTRRRKGRNAPCLFSSVRRICAQATSPVFLLFFVYFLLVLLLWEAFALQVVSRRAGRLVTGHGASHVSARARGQRGRGTPIQAKFLKAEVHRLAFAQLHPGESLQRGEGHIHVGRRRFLPCLLYQCCYDPRTWRKKESTMGRKPNLSTVGRLGGPLTYAAK